MTQQITHPATVADVSITHELLTRPSPAPNYLREKIAIQDLANQMAVHPDRLLPQLVKQAMEICDADSAGISVLDGDEFRWLGLAGRLAAFEGATTPRNFSPCGICIDQRSAILMARPERVYGWIADTNVAIPEVLLVPLLVGDGKPIGTLWVVSGEGLHFNSSHQRAMTELAKFTGIALQMVQSDLRLKKALEDQEVLTREMDHRVKNLFAVTESMIRFTARSSTNKEDMAENLTGRLRALSEAHGLVRKAVNPDLKIDSVDLAELIKTILRPYRPPKVQGPEVRLGERATSSIALVFHELATNAAKYGALGTEQGLVKVDWSVADGLLELNWQELNGPRTEPPSKKSFGSVLVESTLSSYGGTIDRAWHPDGLAVIVKLPVTRLSI